MRSQLAIEWKRYEKCLHGFENSREHITEASEVPDFAGIIVLHCLGTSWVKGIIVLQEFLIFPLICPLIYLWRAVLNNS